MLERMRSARCVQSQEKGQDFRVMSPISKSLFYITCKKMTDVQVANVLFSYTFYLISENYYFGHFAET